MVNRRKKRSGSRKKEGRTSPKRNTAASSIAAMEQIAVDESVSEGKHTPLHPRVRIHIHSKRSRLSDADGVSAKAAIDSLVHCGLLHDDGPEEVAEVSYSQEKSQEEETIMYIYEVKDS